MRLVPKALKSKLNKMRQFNPAAPVPDGRPSRIKFTASPAPLAVLGGPNHWPRVEQIEIKLGFARVSHKIPEKPGSHRPRATLERSALTGNSSERSANHGGLAGH